MPKLVGMNHIALEVGDIDEPLDSWRSIFGELELRGHGGADGVHRLGDQFIALAHGRTQPPDRARHFGLVVDDKEAVRERLAGLGIQASSGRSLDFYDLTASDPYRYEHLARWAFCRPPGACSSGQRLAPLRRPSSCSCWSRSERAGPIGAYAG
jgi:hypothetical protein